MNNDLDNAVTPQFRAGTPVYDAMGEQIGTVSEYNAHDQLLVIDKGPFRTENIYVPLATIQRSEIDAVYLSSSADELLNT